MSYLFKDPFSRIDTELIIAKTKEPLGEPTLDKIRTVTFLSLNKDVEPNLDKGILRGIQLLYSLGLGFFITHSFSFSDDVLRNKIPEDSSINGKSLAEILEGKAAYALMYKEYLKIYSKGTNYREDLAKLSNIESVSPAKAKDLARLLILIFVSSKFEG